jgi:homopolymeric O-antigen transport system ATP-binding protein
MSDIVIAAENLSKLYRLGKAAEQSESIVGALASAVAAPFRNLRDLRQLDTAKHARSNGSNSNGKEDARLLWALKDVSFEVKRGEVVGFIGRNGAGKSTLLKILSRVAEPTSGRVRMKGRVAALLEVGTGFHPDLSGRENVYLNGTILGMSKREIDRKFDEIVDFSGVERFLDTPVKRYSSGMKVRLGFAVAANLDPDILIVDEVLAVGDAEFQKKCLNKMNEVVAGASRTVLFVSHNMTAVEGLCNRTVLLELGRVKAIGPTSEVISQYFQMMPAQISEVTSLADRVDREGDGRVRCVDAWLVDELGCRVTQVRCGQDIEMRLQFEVLDPSVWPIDFSVGVYDSYGSCISRLSTQYVSATGLTDRPDRGVAVCRIPRLPFSPGEYWINTSLTCFGGARSDRVERALAFNIHPGDYFETGRLPGSEVAKVMVDHSWRLEPIAEHSPSTSRKGALVAKDDF